MIDSIMSETKQMVSSLHKYTTNVLKWMMYIVTCWTQGYITWDFAVHDLFDHAIN